MLKMPFELVHKKALNTIHTVIPSYDHPQDVHLEARRCLAELVPCRVVVRGPLHQRRLEVLLALAHVLLALGLLLGGQARGHLGVGATLGCQVTL